MSIGNYAVVLVRFWKKNINRPLKTKSEAHFDFHCFRKFDIQLFEISINYQITSTRGRAKMRRRTVSQIAIFDQYIDQLTSLIVPERILRKMDKIIDENDRVVACLHEQVKY